MSAPAMARGMSPAMALALAANFGSSAHWRDAFAALASAHAGRAGMVRLRFLPRRGTLVNEWAAGAQGPAPDIDRVVLLELESAGQSRVDAFVDAIDWEAAYQRYQHAVHAASESAGTDADALAGALLLDVRRAGVFEQAGTMLPGARWCDPARVGEWGADLPPGQQIVVYCVYGHEVGRATALRLRAMGHQAHYLRGGIDGWQAAGRALAARAEP